MSLLEQWVFPIHMVVNCLGKFPGSVVSDVVWLLLLLLQVMVQQV